MLKLKYCFINTIIATILQIATVKGNAVVLPSATARVIAKYKNIYKLYMEDTLHAEDTWLSFTKILLIVIILAILGLNVFNFLARGTDVVAHVGKDATGVAVEGVKKTAGLAAVGLKTGVGVAAGATKSAVDVTSGVLDSAMTELENTLDVHVQDGQQPSADNSDSTIQEHHKSGHCFVGAEKGVRSCVYVGKQDTCISKQIFPTRDICINPQLRV